MSNDNIKFKLEVNSQWIKPIKCYHSDQVLDYDGKKKAEHMCSAVTTMGALRAGGRYSQAGRFLLVMLQEPSSWRTERGRRRER